MSVRFIGPFKFLAQNKIIIRPLGETPVEEDNDWWLVAEPKQREEDRGLITDQVGSSDDWGNLPPIQ
jgi:hypothetical protein